MRRIYYCFPEGKCKVLTMSYDDGDALDARVIEIFNRYGIKGTFNLCYSLIPDKEKVASMYAGHEVASHTMYHPTPDRCPSSDFALQILEDRQGLEDLTGYVVSGFTYPNSGTTKEIEDMLPGLGFVYARNDTKGFNQAFRLPENPLNFQPTCHHNDPRLMEYGEYLVNYKDRSYLKFMCVYGHSHEFGRQDNWNVLEDFCALVGGKDDIWYATCIELFDYLQAAKRLRYSADCKTVYNPSAVSVWVDVNGEAIVEAKGGCCTGLM